jgi:hypothetical protein
MKAVVTLLLACAVVGAQAQEPQTGLHKSKPKAVPNVAGYVTEADAKAVFARAEQVIRRITGSTATVPAIKLAGSQPITRSKTVEQFERLYAVVRPQVKITPRPVKINMSVIKMSGPAKNTLVRLVKLGAVGNYSNLAAGSVDKLNATEFGDSLGFFLARMAQLTHTPSSKWSPPLMRDR